MSSIDGNGVPALSLDAITWSTLGPVAGFPVERDPGPQRRHACLVRALRRLVVEPIEDDDAVLNRSQRRQRVAKDEVGGDLRRAAGRRKEHVLLARIGGAPEWAHAAARREQQHHVSRRTAACRRVAGETAQERVRERGRARGLQEAPALQRVTLLFIDMLPPRSPASGSGMNQCRRSPAAASGC